MYKMYWTCIIRRLAVLGMATKEVGVCIGTDVNDIVETRGYVQ